MEIAGETPGTKIVLQTYGQRVLLDAARADALILADPSASLLPEDLFDLIFVPGAETETELAENPSVHAHGSAPEPFLGRAKAIRGSHYDYRGTLKLAADEKASAPPVLPIAVPAGKSDGTVEAEPEAKG